MRLASTPVHGYRMNLSAGLHPPSPPVAELERRIQWPLVAVGAFLVMMLGLLGMAAWSSWAPSPPIVGIPNDPDVRAARDLVSAIAPPGSSELRFESEFLAAAGAARPATAADAWRIAGATALVARARARAPGDPRLTLCAAHLELARRDYAGAERGYRSVLYFGDRCPEAHLGLGLSLALAARMERDVIYGRSLELQSIAQFAAVRERDAPYLAAAYDRVVMLARVGRNGEARGRAAEYLARDSTSPWAERLRGIAGVGSTPLP